VHRQGGLSHPGGAGHGGDHRGRRCLRHGLGEQLVELAEVLHPAGEASHVGRQLRRRHGRRRWLRGRRRDRCRPDLLAAQNRLVYGLRLGPRIGAQLGGQALAQPRVLHQRLGRPAGGVQGAHEGGDRRLHQRVLGDQLGQADDHWLGVADPQLRVRPRDSRLRILPRPALPGAFHPGPGQAGERLPPPQRERLAEQLDPALVVAAGVAGALNEVAEAVAVHPIGVDGQHIPAGTPQQVRPRARGGIGPRAGGRVFRAGARGFRAVGRVFRAVGRAGRAGLPEHPADPGDVRVQ
jgi:hypothetical protein